MPSPSNPERTAFSLDVQGRYLCNGLDEALNSTDTPLSGNPVRPGARPFDVIIIGGGTFGSAVAQHLFFGDITHSHRILVLEAGPFTLPEHVQNMPMIGEPPVWGVPWNTNVPGGFPGLLFTIGGRSLTWGGWSPQLLDFKNDTEMPSPPWPGNVVNDLNNRYFRESSDQIGVSETNDFIFGPLHNALRDQLYQGIKNLPATSAVMKFTDLPDAAAVRFASPQPTVDDLRNWLGIPGSPLSEQELLDLFKLEAPLAVQSQTNPGQFPINKFSAIQLLIKAARAASAESALDDVNKRLMVVPNCHVRKLLTTQDAGKVRVSSIQTAVDPNDPSKDIFVPVSPNAVVIVAMATIESTRLALLSFAGILPQNVYSRIGQNLMAHLRSNLTIRIPREALQNLPIDPKALQTSALFVKGRKEIGGKVRHFHLQITATGAGRLNTDSEAELFKKIPDIDTLEALRTSNDTSVVITIRGIGEMAPQNPDSNVTLDLNPTQTDFTVRKAFVNLGDARANPSPPTASQQTQDDHSLWEFMDQASDEVATIFAGGFDYEILLPPQGKVNEIIKVPGATQASQLKNLVPYDRRRDVLGSTHHETGTLRMGDPNDAVTDEFGLIYETTNAYVVGPALFPTIGSPNPMLTGVALARRTGNHLLESLPHFVAPVLEPNFEYLFDGTEKTSKRWQMSTIRNQPPGRNNPGTFMVIDGVLQSFPGDDLGLFWYPTPTPPDFILKLEWRRSQADDNSGVFIRFPDPNSKGYNNTAFVGVDFGFEVQIDELGAPDGAAIHKTGAIYNEPIQTLTQQPAKPLGEWNEYEIRVQGQTYTVLLNGTQVTTFQNTNLNRGLASTPTAPSFIGLQVYPGKHVAFRNIRIKAL